jgi:dienelactone hydrolase
MRILKPMPSESLDPGYLARPDANDAPGVAMIHDGWGGSDPTRDLAERGQPAEVAVLPAPVTPS